MRVRNAPELPLRLRIRIRRCLGAFYLGGEQPRHPRMSVALGELLPLFEYLYRSGYVAFGEMDAGFAKNTRVALTGGVGNHD